jgi:hypothetical protein
MSRKVIDVGVVGNDGTGDSIRDSFRKVNDNFRELYSSLGLGEKLTFIGLDDTPLSYAGQNITATGSTPLLTVNNTESGIAFKRLDAGTGITIDYITDPDKITINSDFAEISGDPNPKLGGDLSAKFGTNQYRIKDLTTPITATEAVNKAYADTKVSRAGVATVDPATGLVNSALGTMSGPLILSRSPELADDELYDGLIAATKSYVDNAAFGSVANLFVATSGSDDRPGLAREFQGRALAYAYRTLEAACKRAEELVLDARQEIGPYKKVLTYTKTAIQYNCILALAPYPSPSSGSSFAGTVRMGVSAVTLSSVGTNYFPGDILQVSGGTVASGGGRATIEVLTTLTTPGAIGSFRIISSGSYQTTLPGSSSVATTIITSAAPAALGAIGTGATFNITYKVNSVAITNGGTGYSLVSVRITGGGGAGAFGTGVVTAGVVTSITITDQGSGFTSIPTLSVDLPRFAIKTEFQRTDFTGDVISTTPEAIRGRDIREGLFLYGETSGALAQILGHSGALDAEGNELFDVDIKYGAFEVGEVISYGDVTKNIHISIIVESGIYEENYPLKVPQNTSIVGDEFRRCIIRPRSGTSSSPWAFQKFRRDLTIDGLTTAERLYGYHYLIDTSEPVYPRIDNKGAYTSAAALIDLNRQFLQNEIIAWVDAQVTGSIAPFASFTYNSEYNAASYRRDVGLILDAMVFDLKWGEYNRTVSAALKYYQSAGGLIAIGAQISQTLAIVTRLNALVLSVIANTVITVNQTAYPQIIDLAYAAESGSSTVINLLFTTLEDIMDESGPGYGSVNQPKNNDQLDVFLANDAVRWQAITCQGHGGFMLTLDPAGQILAKSPYAQECASFSKSKDAQTFAGGMFVDGFSGNLQWRHDSSDTTTRLNVSGLHRFPQLPASFLVDDTVFRVNYVRDFVYNPSGSAATFILDETTPFTRTAGAQTCTISLATPAVITKADHRLQAGAIIIFSTTGTLPSGISAGVEYFVMATGLANNTFQITATFGSTTAVNTTSSGSGTHSYQRTYELLMPGNRSMLGNDYTQINDMGYGIIANNGGLVEAVSMFTYYAYTSYYSLNGGQIRSIGGSSAHGVYALVAEGADPLEIPTPTGTFEELAQKVKCYFPSGPFANVANGLSIFVHAYDYAPLGNAELEIDHGAAFGIYRYPVTSVTISDEYPTGVARLNLSSGVGSTLDGLADVVADNTLMTYRLNGQIILTGGLVDVAVRPSTGLKLRETEDTVYRVLEFATYTDTNGPYEVTITNASPAVLKVLATVTTIATNVCTTSQNHKLKVGDKFIPTSTANNFVSGTTYYVLTVPEYNQFTVSTSPGGSTFVLTNGSGLTIKGVKTHKLLENYTIAFTTTGTLPTGVAISTTYYILPDGLTDTEFRLSLSKNGTAINTSTAGSGVHSYAMVGLTKTSLRENYDYNDLTLWQPGEFISSTPTGTSVTNITLANPAEVQLVSHGFSAGDVIKFTTSGTGINLPTGLSKLSNYHVLAAGLGANVFRVSLTPGGTAADTSTGSFTDAKVGKVTGRVGDSSFAVVPIGGSAVSRIDNSKFVFKGVEYIITNYETEGDTGEAYARVNLDKPLVDNVISYLGIVTIKSAVPTRSNGSLATLTIRISLTRVTSHDLLEIGTGSYADTNYPSEIFGAAVNALQPDDEVQERDVGRCFYVTTDQYGNFNVGPYFRVDQGTGTVTFSSSIALSNLDGIGFKRGVTVAEFSPDSGFELSRTDTVPTENAIRKHVERRLGLLNDGVTLVDDDQLLPANNGGFMPLYPVAAGLAMKANMPLGGFKIIDVGDPTLPQDAVNLRSLTFDNFQDVSTNTVDASDILVFTGSGNTAVNATVTGDITFDLRTGVDSALNTIDVQINADTIVNADVNSAAAIDQAKLNLDNAYATVVSGFTGATATGSGSVATLTFSSSSATTPFTAGQRIVVSGLTIAGYNGIQTVTGGSASTVTYASTTTGSATSGTIRPLKGISSFDTAQFTVTDGFVTLKSNGTTISRLEQIGSLTVLGNSSLSTASVSQVAFSTVVDSGGAVKKSQYSSTGFLRRTNGVSSTSDGDYTVVEAASGSSASFEVSKLVIRDSNGDFGGRTVDISQLKMDTKLTIDTAATATGGYIRYYGYDTAGGILISDGSLAADKATGYWNNAHNFKTQNGASDAPISCSQIQTLLLTTGAAATLGDVTGNWRLTSGSKLQATYSADLAEWYTSDKKHEPGTVLVFGGDAETTTTNIEGDTRVAGVVSTDPAYVLNGQLETVENAVCVALQGRVPCRVVGKIKKGQMLITSKIPGVAVAGGDDIKVGTVVGKALVDYDSDHIGTIEIAVGRT